MTRSGARSLIGLPSPIFAGNAVSVRRLGGLATPTLWGASLRRGCNRHVQRRSWQNLLLEHDHPPECVARALPSDPRAPRRAGRGGAVPALSQLAWAHLKAVEATCPRERYHCAAGSREAHNPKIVVR